jgi:hypothetical protein
MTAAFRACDHDGVRATASAGGQTAGYRYAVAATAVLLAMVFAAPAATQTSPDSANGESETEIDVKVTDPLSSTWSLKTQDNLYVLDVHGHGHRLQDTLVFQPLMPVWLTRGLKLITRPKFTLLNDEPYVAAGDLHRTAAVGDTILDVALSPRTEPWLVALGPTFVFPTANSVQTGQGAWQVGPVAAARYRGDHWLAALIAQQWWSVAGAGSGPVRALNLQYLASYSFAGGWSVGTSPTIKVNWEASPGDRVTFPFGPSVGKVVKLAGGMPVKFEIQVNYSPIHPASNGQILQVQFTATPVIPGLLDGLRLSD